MTHQKWPKSRPPMSDKVKAIYEHNYVSNRSGAGLVNTVTMYLEQWMHRKVSENQVGNERVLELGPGNLNHIHFLKCSAWDVVEPYDPLYDDGKAFHHLVRKRYRNVSEVPSAEYDRLYSIAVLEHVAELPELLSECFRALKHGGRFQAAVPSEGGFLWKLMSWKIKGFFFRMKYNADYKEIMRWEHINTATEIVEEIEKVFGDVRVTRFPNLGNEFSLYTYIEAYKL